jgi:hypothetical protein
MAELEERLARADEQGTSSLMHGDASKEDLFSTNRAGHNETRLSEKQIVDYYCKQRDASKPKPVGKRR